MTATAPLRLGLDLGGTKMEAVVVELGGDAPRELSRVRVPTEREGGYEHVLERAASTVRRAARDAGLADLPPVGVGMPGSVTTRRAHGSRADAPLVKNSNTTCLNGRPFRADLTRELGGAAIAFSNDANCFALAEATWGAARGAEVTFGVILGTGVGGGLVLARGGAPPAAWDGHHGIAGEWGHVVLEPRDGPPCYCGKRGCVETLVSGPAIHANYTRRGGVAVDATDIAARARAGEALAQAVLAEVMDHFGRALATVIDVLDPDVIVLGGGVSNMPELYDAGREAAARWVFNDELTTPIRRHALGDSAGVLGAALLPGLQAAHGASHALSGVASP
ncbi:MAG: ROK family protein [Polyangiaceae bacterium]